MQRGNLNDLLAFLAVGQERSFTRAAAKLSVSQTEAGERLLHTIGPRFEEIESELAALSEFREKPAGTIRITATDYAVETILWPKLTRFLRRYPDVKFEVIIDYGLTDIVA